MKSTPWLLSSTVLAAFLLLSPTVSAQTLLSVDFNLNNNTLTQSGFTGFSLTNPGNVTNPSQTIGDYTVTVFGGSTALGGRDRGNPTTNSGDFTAPNLYRDLVTNFEKAPPSTPATYNNRSFSLSGLASNTTYSLRIWSYDSQFNNGAISTFYDVTGLSATPTVPGTSIGSITNQTGTAGLTSNTAFSLLADVTTDSTGALFIGSSFSAGSSGQINAIELSVVPVPEPSTFALAGLGVLGLALLRRRRKA